jgi:hypothetical protein
MEISNLTPISKMRQLRDATIDLLEAVFSMRSVPLCYKQNKACI